MPLLFFVDLRLTEKTPLQAVVRNLLICYTLESHIRNAGLVSAVTCLNCLKYSEILKKAVFLSCAK